MFYFYVIFLSFFCVSRTFSFTTMEETEQSEEALVELHCYANVLQDILNGDELSLAQEEITLSEAQCGLACLRLHNESLYLRRRALVKGTAKLIQRAPLPTLSPRRCGSQGAEACAGLPQGLLPACSCKQWYVARSVSCLASLDISRFSALRDLAELNSNEALATKLKDLEAEAERLAREAEWSLIDAYYSDVARQAKETDHEHLCWSI
jgi:hypothetical protein